LQKTVKPGKRPPGSFEICIQPGIGALVLPRKPILAMPFRFWEATWTHLFYSSAKPELKAFLRID
jgi:hypothetical protein